MKKIILNILSIGILTGVTACTSDYVHYNTNPYDATQNEMERDGYSIRSALTNIQ